MFRILLPILFLFVSVGLNAQQVNFDGQACETTLSAPIDTTWCRQHKIDKVELSMYWCHIYKEGTVFIETEVLSLTNGIPVSSSHKELPNEKQPVTLSQNPSLFFDYDNGKAANDGEAVAKQVSYGVIGSENSFEYTHCYYLPDNKIKDIVYVRGMASNTEDFASNKGIIKFYYDDKGRLKEVANIWSGKKSFKHTVYKCKYRNGQVRRVYEQNDPFGNNRRFDCITKIAYYSNGKKVKP